MAASATAPSSAWSRAPLAISSNMVIGNAALASASMTSTRRRPIRSDQAPANGVTTITTTAAIVDSHKASRSGSDPAEVRNEGT